MKQTIKFQIHFGNEDMDYPHHPDEDAIVIKGNSIGVFDGVTLEYYDPYPVPSPAAEAAYLGAQAAAEHAAAHVGEKDFLLESFKSANLKIKALNEGLGITPQTVNYLSVQYAAAVGAISVYDGQKLHYAQITDCGVMVCRPNGEIIDNLIVDNANMERYVEDARRSGKFDDNAAGKYIFERSKVYNNPDARYKDVLLNEGVLTGEEIALKFVQSKQIDIYEPAHGIVYSDGFIPLLNKLEVRKKLFLPAPAKQRREHT